MTSLPVIPGEEGFVHPATYLRRPRGQSQSMAPAKIESAVERDQRIGLVSVFYAPLIAHLLPMAADANRSINL